MSRQSNDVIERDNGAGNMPSTIVGELASDLSTIQAITKAELDQQIVTAKAYPRSLMAFQRDCRSMATLSEGVAKECFYALPRDGKIIQGPSVRLAEIVVSAWGNCRAGSRVIEEGRDFIVAQGIFHDLERGTVISSEVRRRIVGKNGRRYSPDMIGTTANAACSIALRNAVFKGVPKALWNGIYEECRRVVAGDAKTLSSRRKDALEVLNKMGATNQMIFDTLGIKGIEDIGLDELVTLGGLSNSVKDGEATVEEIFAAKPDAEQGQQAQSRSDQAKSALKAQDNIPHYDEATARAAIGACKSLAELDAKWKEIVADYKNRDLPLALEAARNDRRAALEG